MITILIFTITVISTISLNLIFNPFKLSPLYIILGTLFGVVVEFAVNGIIATIICKMLPEKWFSSEKKIFKVSKLERKFYNLIAVKKWKDYILELGNLNGFRKNKIQDPSNNEYIMKFIVECNRGFLTHLFSIIIGSCVIFIYPTSAAICIGIPILFANFLINYMSVSILRYNLPKLQALYKRNSKRNVSYNEQEKCSA